MKIPRIFHTRPKLLLSISSGIVAIVYCVSFAAPVFAKPLFSNYPYYQAGRIDSCKETGSGSLGGNDTNSGIPSDGSIWNSGIQPPYIMEQFAVETLKAVAKKRGVPAENTVTQEHIDALLAFMFGEGGDIANKWLYNPLNSGISSSDLVAGEKKANGTQSFKSFDAGIEGTARTMVGKNQSRLADTLVNKESTATDFMYALTYYNKFAGNKLWAEASVPNPGQYYTQRLSLVNQVRKNYNDIASTVMGTAAKEYSAKIRNPAALRKSELRGSNPVTVSAPVGTDETDACVGASPATDNGISKNNITQTAVNFSWPDKFKPNAGMNDGNRSSARTPKPEYAAAIARFNKGQRTDGADCGVFVATVMHASGADPKYPSIGTAVQRNYVKSHPELYDIKEGPAASDLLPGDILVVNNGVQHHTLIYVGPQGEKGYDVASASQDTRSANLGKSGWEKLNIYTRARLKTVNTGATTNDTTLN
ncbi:MAG: hypothetical protein NTX11_01065 [Candidatus Saccharibacteria bacterium]|nr:hypothetical protein [Candidatus Saccharibacteria bacterium]